MVGLMVRVMGGGHGGGGLKTRLGIEGGAVCEADGAELGRLRGGEGGGVERDDSPVLLLTVFILCLSRSRSSELSIGCSSWKSRRDNTLCSSLVSFMSPRIHASVFAETAEVQQETASDK